MRIAVDLDGTVLSCRARHVRLMKYQADTRGLAFDADEYWLLKRKGRSNARALAELRFDEANAEVMCREWLRDVEHWPWLGFDSALDGVISALEDLRRDAERLVVLTARREPQFLLQQLRRADLVPYFDNVVVVQPANVVEEKACYLKQSRIDVWFGDSETDALAGQKANVPFFPVCSGMRSEAYWSEWFEKHLGITRPSLYADLPEAVRAL